MSSSMDPGPKLRLLTNVLLLSDRSGRSRTLSPPLPPFRPRQAVGLVGILVSRSRELEIAVGTVFGFDDRLNRLLRMLKSSPATDNSWGYHHSLSQIALYTRNSF